MLALPLVLGFSLTGARPAAPWWVVPSSVLAFLAHYALVPAIQRARERKGMPADWLRRRLVWGTVYLAGAGIAFAAVVALAPASARPGVLAVGGAGALAAGIFAAASSSGSGRALWSEIVGMTGTALAAPMMAAAAGRPLDRVAFGAAAMALGYFLSTLAFVRSYEGLVRARRAAVRRCLAAHAAIGGALLVAAVFEALPRAWWLAYLPVALRTAVGLARPPANLRALGLREVWVALSFAALAFLLLAT
jgi:hypothetical protein